MLYTWSMYVPTNQWMFQMAVDTAADVSFKEFDENSKRTSQVLPAQAVSEKESTIIVAAPGNY